MRGADVAGVKGLADAADNPVLAPDPRFVEIDSLDGEAVERALVELFEILEFEDVQRIGGFDKGADITFRRDGQKVAVQAKRGSGESLFGIDAICPNSSRETRRSSIIAYARNAALPWAKEPCAGVSTSWLAISATSTAGSTSSGRRGAPADESRIRRDP